MPLTAVVVGGGQGGRLSLDALVASPRFSAVGIADVREEARQKLATDYPGIALFACHEEMFETLRPDVVCVSTYAPTHVSIARSALASGARGLLVEKPIAAVAAEARALVADLTVPVAVPHGLVAKAASRRVLDLVTGGAIGTLRAIEIQCRGWDLVNAGIHWFQFALLAAGSPAVASVMSGVDLSARTYRDGLQVETLAITAATLASGVRVTLHSGDETPLDDPAHPTLFRLIGSDGMIEFYGWEPTLRIFDANGIRVETPPDGPVAGHRFHLEKLADAVEGLAPADTGNVTASLAALEICEAAYLSARLRRAVTPGTTAEPAPQWRPGEPWTPELGGRDGRTFA